MNNGTVEKKNFLFFSYGAYITDLAWTLVKEGHNVKYHVDVKSEREIGDGFVPKTDDWKKEVDWADIIVFDDTLGQGELAHELRKKGKYVVGGTPYTDRLEDDRSFGQEELKKVGIPIIPYQNFTSFDDAIIFVRENPGKYVIKPSGKASNNKRLLFIGEEEDGKDVLQVLEAYKKAPNNKIEEFQLQKRITGVEVGVGGFFNGKEFIYPINVNFEHKRLFPGEKGPLTGEMGTSMFWSSPNRLFNATLKKMESKLVEENYVGYIDLNCIVNNYGIYPLEWTARFGFPTIGIQQEGILNPMGEFLYDLARGNSIKLRTKSGFQVGVEIVVPPFPYVDPETFETHSKESVVIFKKPDHKEGIHIEGIKLVNDEWLIVDDEGSVFTVVGTGQTMKQAQQQAYNRINNIIIPNMYYRTDIGDRWFEDSDKLHNWGYLRES